jgi:hypothetical protein
MPLFYCVKNPYPTVYPTMRKAKTDDLHIQPAPAIFFDNTPFIAKDLVKKF